MTNPAPLTEKRFGWCLHCKASSDQPGWAAEHHDATGHTTMQRKSATRRFGELP